MAVDVCQWRIAAIWYAGFGLLLIGLFLFTTSRPDENHQQAWAWFSASTAPSEVMITGSLVAGAIKQQNARASKGEVDRRFYVLASVLSLSYWLFLLTVFLLETWTHHEKKGYFTSSQLALAPLQGIVISVLSPIFAKPSKRKAGAAKS